MKTFFNIAPVFCILMILSCGSTIDEESSESVDDNFEDGTLYINEYGSIRIIEVNDTMAQVIFKNNNGDYFDTNLVYNPKFTLVLNPDSLPFIDFHWGGIQLFNNRVEMSNFSNIGNYLSKFIQINHAYRRPFYKTGEPITLSGEIYQGPESSTIKGIHLTGKNKSLPAYGLVTGIIKKIPYPITYYNMDDYSPEDMFGDSTKIHCRLIMEEYEIEEIERFRYVGSTMNINGEAAFIWDFAWSEAFYLDNHKPWKKDEEFQNIVIDALLVQFIDRKSVLKYWTIVRDD